MSNDDTSTNPFMTEVPSMVAAVPLTHPDLHHIIFSWNIKIPL